MTKYAKNKHIKSGGLGCCPFCRVEAVTVTTKGTETVIESNIEWQELTVVENRNLEQAAECFACNKKWIDKFQFVDVKEIC